MKRWLIPAVASLCLGACALAQTADEVVNKNIEAKSGLEKIKAVKTLRITGRAEEPEGPPLTLVIQHARPEPVSCRRVAR